MNTRSIVRSINILIIKKIISNVICLFVAEKHVVIYDWTIMNWRLKWYNLTKCWKIFWGRLVNILNILCT